MATLGERYRGVAAGLVAGALVLTACSAGSDEGAGDAASEADSDSTGETDDEQATAEGSGEPSYGGTARVDWVADAPSLDPLRFNSLAAFFTYSLVYDTLLTWTDAGELEPLLASEMPTVSDDGMRYEIPVRDDVEFHDGSPLTPEDVAHTLDVVRDPENSSIWYAALSTVDAVEIDGDAVVLTLAEPYAPLEWMLARIHIISSDEPYVANETWANRMLGTGPFEFISWDQGSEIVLERNDAYHVEGLPYLDGVEIAIVPEDAARIANIASGESHIMPMVPYDQIGVLEGRGVDVEVLDDSVIMPTIWPSLQDGRPTADPAVRQAIAWAIDRGQLIEQVYAGHATTAANMHASGILYWDEEIGTTYGESPNPGEVEAALGRTGVDLDRPLELVHRAEPLSTAVATFVQANLADVGIDIQLSAEEAASYFPKLISGDFDLMLLSVEGGPAAGNTPHYVYGALRSGSTGNFHGFADDELDELLDAAVTNPADPAAAWRAVQERELEVVPYIPLVTARYVEAVADDLAGYEPSSLISLRGLEHAYLR